MYSNRMHTNCALMVFPCCLYLGGRKCGPLSWSHTHPLGHTPLVMPLATQPPPRAAPLWPHTPWSHTLPGHTPTSAWPHTLATPPGHTHPLVIHPPPQSHPAGHTTPVTPLVTSHSGQSE